MNYPIKPKFSLFLIMIRPTWTQCCERDGCSHQTLLSLLAVVYLSGVAPNGLRFDKTQKGFRISYQSGNYNLLPFVFIRLVSWYNSTSFKLNNSGEWPVVSTLKYHNIHVHNHEYSWMAWALLYSLSRPTCRQWLKGFKINFVLDKHCFLGPRAYLPWYCEVPDEKQTT